MSLSNWCQSYVYMPTIGLTRNPYLAVYATMSAIALWHAGTLTWFCWGLYHATGIVIFLTWGRCVRKWGWNLRRFEYYPVLAQAVTLLFVIGSFSFMAAFKQGEVYPAFRLLAKLVGVTLQA
jgi:alginate O-acetyltransferase complex protein AlgI